MRMDFTEMQYPPLHPLLLLERQHRLEVGTNYQDGYFVIEREDATLVLSPMPKVLPSDWDVRHDRSSPKTEIAYLITSSVGPDAPPPQGYLHHYLDQVTVIPGAVSYKGWRRRGAQSDPFQLGLDITAAQNPEGGGLLIECTWSYDDCRPIQKHHGPIWLLIQWRKLVERVMRARLLFKINAPESIMVGCTALINESLHQLGSAASSLRGLICGAPPHFLDLDIYKERLRLEIPPHLHSLLDNPDRIPGGIRTDALAVTVRVRGGELVRARVAMKTNTGPSDRPKRGFAFIQDLLGVVPQFVHQNTDGQNQVHELDIARIEKLTDVGYELADPGSALLIYGQVARRLLTERVKPYLDEFAASGWEEASLIPMPN